MSKSERRIHDNKIRRMRQLRTNISFFIITLFLVITFSFVINGFVSNAKSGNDDIEFKYYKSIVVEKGDTLWSIASRNINPIHNDTESYIKEIMEMNGLHDEHITAGSYLVIPYFSNEFVG